MLALAGVGLLGLATPAFAHNSLTGSNPANEASLDVGPQTVELTFDQPVQEGDGLNSVAVTGPDGTHWEGGPAKVDSNVVSAPVRELGPEGHVHDRLPDRVRRRPPGVRRADVHPHHGGQRHAG